MTCSYQVKALPIYIWVKDSLTNSQMFLVYKSGLNFQMNFLKTMLERRVFQLARNYMTESEASESHRGYIENQLKV